MIQVLHRRYHIIILVLSVWVACARVGAETHTFEGVRRPHNNPGCENIRGSIKGQYTFGLIGPTCPAVSMGTSLRAELLYDSLIVDGKEITLEPDANNEKRMVLTAEAFKYVQDYGVLMTNLIDQIAEDFLMEQAELEMDLRKGAPPSPQEIEAWQLLVKVFAYQESLLTHYQYSDRDENQDHKLRILVGDPVYARACENKEGVKRCRVRRDERGRAQVLRDKNGNLVYAALGMYQIHSSSSHKSTLLERNDQLDLVKNIEAGMNYIYPRWSQVLGYRKFQSAALKNRFQKCRGVVHPKAGVNYTAAIRAAYGMYNGGDSDICRFYDSDAKNRNYQTQNPGCYVGRVAFRNEAQKRNCESKQKCGAVACPWVNDTRISLIITKKPWQQTLQITDEERQTRLKGKDGRYPFAFDLRCVRRGDSICLHGQDPKQSVFDFLNDQSEPKLFTTMNSAFQKANEQENFCVFDNSKNELLCTEREDLVSCLRNKQNFPLSRVKTSRQVGRAYYTLHRLPLDAHHLPRRVSNDIRDLCAGGDDGVFVPGEFLVLLKKAKLLKEPRLTAAVITSLLENTQLQVLDVKIDIQTGLDRWYKVALAKPDGQMHEGYIYGGDDLDWSSYVAPKITGEPLPGMKFNVLRALQHKGDVLYVLPVPGQKIQLRRSLRTYNSLDEIQTDLSTLNIDDLKKLFQPALEIEKGTTLEVLGLHLYGDSQFVLLEVREQSAPHRIHFIRVGQLRSLLKSIHESITENIDVLPQ